LAPVQFDDGWRGPGRVEIDERLSRRSRVKIDDGWRRRRRVEIYHWRVTVKYLGRL